jgi:hypothetical protein
MRRHTLRQILMGNRRRRNNNQIHAIDNRDDMRAVKIRSGKPVLAGLRKRDSTLLYDWQQSRIRTGKQPNFVAAQRQISRRCAPAIASAENSYFTNCHSRRETFARLAIFQDHSGYLFRVRAACSCSVGFTCDVFTDTNRLTRYDLTR